MGTVMFVSLLTTVGGMTVLFDGVVGVVSLVGATGAVVVFVDEVVLSDGVVVFVVLSVIMGVGMFV
jgi:hypothetical protein